MPKNVFLLKAQCYLYNWNRNPNEKVKVTKEVIIEILRQDIRAYIKRWRESQK